MAATSSGRKERPTKVVKGGTASTRKHRFESFNQRIAKLNIDPIRRIRRQDVDPDDTSVAASFLRAGLERWRDLNLSENFTNFLQEAEPLCDSLPQIIHYHQRIMDKLAVYIEKNDALSLEPLLNLLGHFAHDLGTMFETHFPRAVAIVASLAAKHTDVEVIEWSFTCLAWLFKYLSRLLVPDLRPLFDIMAPLLGREHQKTYTTRFAAEAVSFLLRKAARTYHKNSSPLTIIVQHIFDDLSSVAGPNNNVQLYQHGLMTLFADAIKGIKREVHSYGAVIYRCLLDTVLDQNQARRQRAEDVISGITISLIHHTEASTFEPILQVLLLRIKSLKDNTAHGLITCGRLLLVDVAVRKGSRIQDWNPVVDGLLVLLALLKPHNVLGAYPDAEDDVQLFMTAAVIFQLSPLKNVIPRLRGAMDIITSESNTQLFLPFCHYFYKLGQERFKTLLSPYFQKYDVFLRFDVLMLIITGSSYPNGGITSSNYVNLYLKSLASVKHPQLDI